MLPTKWPKAPIESLCTRVTSGGTPSRSNPAFYEGGTIPWIKTGELRGWYVDAISERITLAAVKGSSAKIFPAETVLLAMYGDGRTMGSVGLTRAPAATNQACCAMLTDSERCAPKFLMYALMHYKPALLKLAISGAQRNLSGKSIKEFEIGAPPVEIQHRIASILSAYDDLIENNTRRIAILEEMARRIYEEWFVHFRFPGHEGVRMVESGSDLGLVPEGWNVVSLETQYKTASGGTPSREHPEYFGGDIKWVKTKELNDGFIFTTEESITGAGLSNSSAKVFARNTLLIAMYGATIGRLGILSTPAATNQACCAVMPVNADFSVAYAYLTLLTRRQELIDLRTGAAQQNINQITIRKFPLLSPPLSILAAFNSIVQPMLRLYENLQSKNANLRTTRDLLLPKLISGELDVSTLPEPQAEAA